MPVGANLNRHVYRGSEQPFKSLEELNRDNRDPKLNQYCYYYIRRLVCNNPPTAKGPAYHWDDTMPYTKEDVHKCLDPNLWVAPKDQSDHIALQCGRLLSASEPLEAYRQADDLVYFDRLQDECAKCTKASNRKKQLDKRRKSSKDGDDGGAPGGATGRKRSAGGVDSGSAGKRSKRGGGKAQDASQTTYVVID